MVLAIIENWHHRARDITSLAASSSVPFRVYRPYLDEDFPQKDEVTAAIVSGGPMSVCKRDHPGHRHIAEVEAFVEDCLDAERPVLGICLGHQILAKALGGHVEAGSRLLVGACNVELTIHAGGTPLDIGSPELDVFACHRDHVAELPSTCIVTAISWCCSVEGFCDSQRRVFGVQFHPEVTLKSGRSIMAALRRRSGNNHVRRLGPPAFDVGRATQIIRSFIRDYACQQEQ